MKEANIYFPLCVCFPAFSFLLLSIYLELFQIPSGKAFVFWEEVQMQSCGSTGEEASILSLLDTDLNLNTCRLASFNNPR